MRSHLLSPRYSCYNVPCAFKCAKHHVCLAGPSAPRWGRDRLCFLSYGDFAFVPPSPPRWLAERVGKQSHPVCRCLYIFCTQEARCTFSPCTGKGEGRQMYKAPSGKQCLLLQSLLAADRQPQLSPLKLQSAENKQAAAYSRAPADYFCPHLYCHFIFRLFHYLFIYFCPAHHYSRVQDNSSGGCPSPG